MRDEEFKVKSQALKGIKVADFSWFAAAPSVAMWLAEHGAQVIRIESLTHPDGMRPAPPMKDGISGVNRSGWFAHFNTNKYGISLDLNHPKGLQVAKKIIAWSDVVIENFTPGKMAKWGLGYEDIRKIKPEIIMLSSSTQGQTGPRAYTAGVGVLLVGLAGFIHFSGWPDRDPPAMANAYTDMLAAPLGLVAVMAALATRLKTNKGQWIDLSQFECSLHYLAPALLDYVASGQEGSRRGNCHSWAAPHGAYRCRGVDRWCVISVFSDQEWQTLCHVMGQPALADDSELASLLNRKKREEELNSLIEKWTINYTPEEVVSRLQENGIAAGVVEDAKDILEDPQLKYRQHFVPLNHPEIGEFRVEAPPWKLSETPAELRMPAPCLGEHTEYVCTQILGMSDEEFVELLNEEVFQ